MSEQWRLRGPHRRHATLAFRTLFRIARQMLIEVGDGSSKQVLLVVVIRVQARAARIADVLTPLFDLDQQPIEQRPAPPAEIVSSIESYRSERTTRAAVEPGKKFNLRADCYAASYILPQQDVLTCRKSVASRNVNKPEQLSYAAIAGGPTASS